MCLARGVRVCVQGGVCPGWVSARGHLLGVGVCRGVSTRGGVHSPEPTGRHLSAPLRAGTHTPVNRMTDRCQNIALPQTSFAGGNCLWRQLWDIITKTTFRAVQFI